MNYRSTNLKKSICTIVLILMSTTMIYFFRQKQVYEDSSLLPSIGTVFPEPNSSLSVELFQQSTNLSGAPFVTLEDSSICIQIWGEGLIESGDYESTNAEVLERFSLTINGSEYLGKPVEYSADSFGRTVPDNLDTGDRGYFIPPGFPSILCYSIPPIADDYQIQLNFLSKSERLLKYRWSFRLTKGKRSEWHSHVEPGNEIRGTIVNYDKMAAVKLIDRIKKSG